MYKIAIGINVKFSLGQKKHHILLTILMVLGSLSIKGDPNLTSGKK